MAKKENVEKTVEEAPIKVRKPRAKKIVAPVEEVKEVEAVQTIEDVKAVDPKLNIVIVGTLNVKILEILKKASVKDGFELVILEDRVVTDYLAETSEAYKKENAPKSLKSFLSDERNRKDAEEKATQLFDILTKGNDIEKSKAFTFKTTDVTKKSNLSHSQANQVLSLLHAFGLIEYLKGQYIFRFLFTKSNQTATIRGEVKATVDLLNANIERFNASVKNDPELSEEQRRKLFSELENEVNEGIEY